jgi:hypothetical protein
MTVDDYLAITPENRYAALQSMFEASRPQLVVEMLCEAMMRLTGGDPDAVVNFGGMEQSAECHAGLLFFDVMLAVSAVIACKEPPAPSVLN